MLKINKNNLAFDPSPYLQQHKNNPVNWQIWSKEAFEIAKKKENANFIKHRLLKLSLVSCNGTRKF